MDAEHGSNQRVVDGWVRRWPERSDWIQYWYVTALSAVCCTVYVVIILSSIQCFDAVGLASGRLSGL